MLEKARLVMQRCGLIGDKMVCADSTVIVYSYTRGILAALRNLEEAEFHRGLELNRCAERGRESDALIFQWLQGQWLLCGDLYDIEEVHRGRSFP